jgi:hypothetical protein
MMHVGEGILQDNSPSRCAPTRRSIGAFNCEGGLVATFMCLYRTGRHRAEAGRARGQASSCRPDWSSNRIGADSCKSALGLPASDCAPRRHCNFSYITRPGASFILFAKNFQTVQARWVTNRDFCSGQPGNGASCQVSSGAVQEFALVDTTCYTPSTEAPVHEQTFFLPNSDDP